MFINILLKIFYRNTSTANLKYLTSEQALADAAVFIQSINKKEKIQHPKWVVFGGSYPGM